MSSPRADEGATLSPPLSRLRHESCDDDDDDDHVDDEDENDAADESRPGLNETDPQRGENFMSAYIPLLGKSGYVSRWFFYVHP